MKKIDFNTAIKTLEEGKRVYCNDDLTTYYKYKDNVLCGFKEEGLVYYNVCIVDEEDYFYLPEEPKPFEITETGFYKTKSGKRAYVFYIETKSKEHNLCHCVLDGRWEVNYCYTDGKSGVCSCSPITIVAKWGDDE